MCVKNLHLNEKLLIAASIPDLIDGRTHMGEFEVGYMNDSNKKVRSRSCIRIISMNFHEESNPIFFCDYYRKAVTVLSGEKEYITPQKMK
jgi:hypothetical protein